MKVPYLVLLTSLSLTTACSTLKKSDAPLVVDTIKSAGYYKENDHEMCTDYSIFNKITRIKKQKVWNESVELVMPERDIASEESLLTLAGSGECPDITKVEVKEIIETIKRLGGKVIDPRDYSDNREGFKKYMSAVGVSPYFDPEEMITPNKPSIAKECGSTDFLPPKCRWLSGAVQGIIATKIHEKIGKNKDIVLRNWWRPACYNKAVGGAKTSDHIQARGFDLDFETSKARAEAQNFVCQMYKVKPFNLQVGIGCNTLHVGVGSPKRLGAFPENGSRFWVYGTLDGCEVKRLETDDCWTMDKNGNKYIHSKDLSADEGAL